MVLTTHSPYTLTIINNLIYAAKVGKNHSDDVNKVVDKSLWLSWENVEAYRIMNGHAENILDDEIHEIKAELIDEVSQAISSQYNRLMDIEIDEGNED